MEGRKSASNEVRRAVTRDDLLLMLRFGHVFDLLGEPEAPLSLLRLLPVPAEARRLLQLTVGIRGVGRGRGC